MTPQDFLELRRKTIAQLRRASDAVRSGNTETSLETSTLARYLADNQIYFTDDVFVGQIVQPDTAARVIENQTNNDPYYRTALEDLGQLRSGRGHVSSFEILHPVFLKPLAQRFFFNLGADKNFETEAQFLQWLAIADFTLQLIHPVKDGTGRSGEDLLTRVSRDNGYPLTFSITGYRAALDTPSRDLFHRHVTERIGFIEFARIFQQTEGLDTPGKTPWQIIDIIAHLRTLSDHTDTTDISWPNVDAQVRDQTTHLMSQADTSGVELLAPGHPYRRYATFMAQEITYLLLCLEDPAPLFPSLLDRYPLSMACRLEDLNHARRNQYLEIPNSIASTTDDVMARIDLLRLGKMDSDDAALAQDLSRILDWNAEISPLFEREYQSQSMEQLLRRLNVPNGWSLSPREFRAAINQTMNWSI